VTDILTTPGISVKNPQETNVSVMIVVPTALVIFCRLIGKYLATNGISSGFQLFNLL
jgi:hypothetical protein